MNSINLTNVSLRYPYYSIENTSIKNKFLSIFLNKKINTPTVKDALKSISINFQDGDRIALMGPNGSGKTSFLKLVAGIYFPSEGNIEIVGKIGSIFNVTLGMENESSGEENIHLILALLEIPRHKTKIEEIITFSDLGDDIYKPIKYYSSGMLMRLAFSIVTSIEVDILIMDELISVGDKSFILKAQERLAQLIDSSKIFFLASHSDEMLRKFCNKGLLIVNGEIIKYGDFEEVNTYYNNYF